jgi:HAD superfamily hydrolase (TIGR01509 family)
MEIKGAIFDCDGTLVDSLGFWEIFYKKVGETYFGGKKFIPDPADDKAMRTQNVIFLGKIMHDHYGIDKSPEAVSAWCLDIFAWYYNEIVELKPGVRELLAHLKQKGVRMCIASAAEVEMIRLVLGRHGVLEYFEGIVSCTTVGAGKDKPDVFLAAEKFLCTPHDKTWVFEDSLLAIETAKGAGFRICGIYDACSFGQEQARELCDVYVNKGGSFAEILPLIK